MQRGVKRGMKGRESRVVERGLLLFYFLIFIHWRLENICRRKAKMFHDINQYQSPFFSPSWRNSGRLSFRTRVFFSFFLFFFSKHTKYVLCIATKYNKVLVVFLLTLCCQIPKTFSQTWYSYMEEETEKSWVKSRERGELSHILVCA